MCCKKKCFSILICEENTSRRRLLCQLRTQHATAILVLDRFLRPLGRGACVSCGVRYASFLFAREVGTTFLPPPPVLGGAMSSAIGGGEVVIALAGAVALAVNAFTAGFPVHDPCLLVESAVSVVRANGPRQFAAPPPVAVAPPPRRAPVVGDVVPPGYVAPLLPPAACGGRRPVIDTVGAARRAVRAVTASGPSRGGVLAGNAAPPPPPPPGRVMPRRCPLSLRGRIAFAVTLGSQRPAGLMRLIRRRRAVGPLRWLIRRL